MVKFEPILDIATMYYDITREELLRLVSEYEVNNSLRSLSTKAGITYQSLIDFKRGKAQLLGDKNLRLTMDILDPEKSAGNSTISSLATIPLTGFINPGGIVELLKEDDKPVDFICPQAMSPVQTKVFLSRDPYFYKGMVIFCEKDIPGVPVAFIGCLCLVEIEDMGPLVKRIELGSKPGYYDLYDPSSNAVPMKDCLVNSSSFVKHIEQLLKNDK
jgi:hypothetical protein